MATENQKTSPSSQAPIANMRAADTAASKSDALGIVWYSAARSFADDAQTFGSTHAISRIVLPRDGLQESRIIKGLPRGGTLKLLSVLFSFPHYGVPPMREETP
jgi:hypothetical protein